MLLQLVDGDVDDDIAALVFIFRFVIAVGISRGDYKIDGRLYSIYSMVNGPYCCTRLNIPSIVSVTKGLRKG